MDLSRPLKKIREKLVQENQQLDFRINLPVKIANQELERIGAIPLPYFLYTQIHPGKQKPSLWEDVMQAECGGMPSHNWWPGKFVEW